MVILELKVNVLVMVSLEFKVMILIKIALKVKVEVLVTVYLELKVHNFTTFWPDLHQILRDYLQLYQTVVMECIYHFTFTGSLRKKHCPHDS